MTQNKDYIASIDRNFPYFAVSFKRVLEILPLLVINLL